MIHLRNLYFPYRPVDSNRKSYSSALCDEIPSYRNPKCRRKSQLSTKKTAWQQFRWKTNRFLTICLLWILFPPIDRFSPAKKGPNQFISRDVEGAWDRLCMGQRWNQMGESLTYTRKSNEFHRCAADGMRVSRTCPRARLPGQEISSVARPKPPPSTLGSIGGASSLLSPRTKRR